MPISSTSGFGTRRNRRTSGILGNRATASSTRYECKENGCRKGTIFSKYRTYSDCNKACRKEFYTCDRDNGCQLIHSDLSPKDREEKSIFTTKEECKEKCRSYYQCACRKKCKTAYSPDPIEVGKETPRPGVLFPHTQEGKEACELAENCDKMCGTTIAAIVFASFIALGLIAGLIAVVVMYLVPYMKKKDARWTK